MLTHTILDAWLDATVAAGGPADAFGDEQGDQAELTSASEALDLTLPSELIALWSWRRFPDPARQLGYDARILSPVEAVRCTNMVRGLFDEFRENDEAPEDGWSRDFIIWNDSQPYWNSVDASRKQTCSRVLTTADGNITEPPSLIANSLGDLFSHWTLLLEAGQHYYRDTTWFYQDGLLPMDPNTSR